MRALEEGSGKRATAATAMNHTSSRSHAIFTLFIDGSRREISAAESDGDDSVLASGITVKFHLVDLAGSERAKKTQATGNRFKEGTAINMGLLSLGNVISALGDDSGPKHIPYRDSKLTRLLQDSLGGNSHTLMIACVSPADYNIEETISTLRYADRARKIKNKPIVNIDDKNEVVSRLRREIHELRMQNVNGGSRNIGCTKEELDKATKQAEESQEEIRQLQTALLACQEEMGHMNEKLLISESSGEKMKTKLKELASEADLMAVSAVDLSLKDSLEKIAKRIHEVVDIQKDGEKKLDDHDLTRFNTSSATVNGTYVADASLGNDADDDDLESNTEATHRKKQSTLANELANLNKVLAQKEALASSMKLNDDKLKEVKEKYEASMRGLESEIAKLQKQKDELNQQQKTDSKSKIAEQRRVRIQALEQQMADLRKKVLEQQRAIKLNEKNESKVKVLNEEIRSVKAAKVKLIKQMKEDADKVRVWKTQKEREVASLKQTERKQQVKIAKMESLHTKRQNVLQRKMEEAQVAKKRLEEIIHKQKTSKAKLSAGKQGLAGAAERIRDMVNQELDIVASIKDATQSRENLLEDRKDLTKQLHDIQKKARQTLTNAERNEMDNKRKQIQAELSARTLEIQSLQKQILQIKEHNQGTFSGTGLSNNSSIGDKGKQWWDGVQTMTEAKLAIEHLFTKASDLMGQSTIKISELTELKSLYDEACRNSVNLEKEIQQMKTDHSGEISSVKKEYEEAQCILLSKLTNPEDGSQISQNDINKFSELHKRVQKMSQECADYSNCSENGATKNKSSNSKKKIQHFQPSTSASDLVNVKSEPSIEDYLKQQDATFTEDEMESDEEDPRDSDWTMTPLYRRIKQVREQNRTSSKSILPSTFNGGKRKSSQDDAEEDIDGTFTMKAPPAKRSLSNEATCKCKTGCKTGRCACVKVSSSCNDQCGCSDLCANKNTEAPARSDSSTLIEPTSNMDNTASTINLLNATFDLPEEKKSAYNASSAKSTVEYSKLALSNFVADDHSLSPKKNLIGHKVEKRNSIFPSPLTDRSPMTDVSNSFATKSKSQATKKTSFPFSRPNL